MAGGWSPERSAMIIELELPAAPSPTMTSAEGTGAGGSVNHQWPVI